MFVTSLCKIVGMSEWGLVTLSKPQVGATPSVVGRFASQHPSGWRLTGEVEDQQGHLVLRSLCFEPFRPGGDRIVFDQTDSEGRPVARHEWVPETAVTPGGGVTSSVIQSVRFGPLLAEILSLAAYMRSLAPPDDEEALFDPARGRREAAEIAEPFPTRVTPLGRRPFGDEYYRQVAVRCIELQSEDPKKPVISRLAKERGDRPVETVRTWVRRARKLGFLAPASAGRAEFFPGPALNDFTSSKETDQ